VTVSKKDIPQAYFEMGYQHRKGACSLTFLSNQEFTASLMIGSRLAKAWPKDMTFSMNPERPKDVALFDYVHNLEGVLLASPKLVTFFRDQKVPDVEFLPVTILDHKGRVASKEYAILNCCRVIDCVDQKKSEFEWDGLQEPSMVVEKVVLDGRALGEDDRLIRPKFVPGKIFYREDLMQAIDDEGFAGVAFTNDLFE
jgi:uncharacterized protein DUF1629